MVKKIQLETTAQEITNFSGIYPVLKFIKKLGLDKLLEKYLSPRFYANQKYSFWQIITVILCGLLAGQKRMKGIELFTKDPIIRKALDIEKAIPDSTIRSRLDGIEAKECYALNELTGEASRRIHRKYFCYCTNMTIGAYQGHKFYGKRGTCENWIEAVKNQMFAGMIVTQNFWLNDFLWNLSVLAYNVSVWMRYLTSTRMHREEPNTFRYWFIKVAGKVIERGHGLILQVSEYLAELPRWIRLYNAIDRLVL